MANLPNTKFSEIYKMFLSSIQDYELKKLFKNIPEFADELLEMYLLKAIATFQGCIKNIYDVDLEMKEFFVRLDLTEKKILCDFMVMEWLYRITNDISQIGLNVKDSDFNIYSENQNLKEKRDYYNHVRERTFQMRTEYLLYHGKLDWEVGGSYGN